MCTNIEAGCINIGAPLSIVGDLQINPLLKNRGRRRRGLKPLENVHRFDDSVYKSLGTVFIPLTTPQHVDPIEVELDVVKYNIPAFLGLDAIYLHDITTYTVTNTSVRRIV